MAKSKTPQNYWLMKTEPDTYSFDDLLAEPEQTDHWDGVRNYQARNFMRDDMRLDDLVLIYHSNTKVPGVVGIARIARESYPDHTQFDPQADKYDPKATEEKPRWFMVNIQAVRKLSRVVSLAEMKKLPELSEMRLVQRGNRLSIMPVTQSEFECVVQQAE